jgi:dienelactone hydrolase
MDSPEGRAIHPADGGGVVAIEEVGGLHQHYERVAA